MQLSEELTYFRVLVSEPDNTGRWSDTDATNLINQSRYSIALEVDWPQGNISCTTTGSVTEYALPAITKVLRVYLAGQVIIPGSIPTLQGDQIEFYDQTATNNQPQWNNQTAATYPVSGTSFGAPYPSSLPFMAGMRPTWYLRGGSIGLIPPPVAAYTLSIDVVPRPAALVNLTDIDNCYDQFFKEAICQGAAALAAQADKDSDSYQIAANAREKALGRIKSWLADLQSGAPKGPMPVVYRGFYQNNGVDN